MRFKFAGLIAIAAMALFLAGCNPSANDNVVTNNNVRPANANAAVTKEKYQREAKQAGRTIGTGLNDGWLWVKTRFDLAAANDLRDSTINVDVNNGVVTLTGTVANAAQKTKAESIAKSVEGVKAVKNILKVAPGTNSNTANANATPRKK